METFVSGKVYWYLPMLSCLGKSVMVEAIIVSYRVDYPGAQFVYQVIIKNQSLLKGDF